MREKNHRIERKIRDLPQIFLPIFQITGTNVHYAGSAETIIFFHFNILSIGIRKLRMLSELSLEPSL